MTRFVSPHLAALAATLLPGSAAGQEIQVESVLVREHDDTGRPPDDLSAMETHVKAGEFAKVRAIAQLILDSAHQKTGQAAYDYRRNVIAVLWAGSDAAGETVVRRMLVPEPTAYAASLDLPGLGPGGPPHHLFEVLLSLDPRSRAVSEYVFTREQNPIEAEIPSAVQQLADPLFGFIAAVAVHPVPGRPAIAESGERRRGPPPSLWATASEVPIPFSRASVKVKTRLRLPISQEDWEDEVGRLAADLTFRQVPRSRVARDCVPRYQEVALAVPTLDACQSATYSAEKCLQAFDAAFSQAHEDCRGSSTLPDADVVALAVVDDKFRGLVTAVRTARAEGSAEFHNTPLTHFGFGLGVALIVDAHLSGDRVKLDDSGNLVRDPLPRAMTMVMLHWSPRGYVTSSPRIQSGERWRLFAAGVITPDVGLAAGGSVLLVRGLGLNVGGAYLFAKSLNSGDSIGAPPHNSNDAFALTTGWAWFAGMNVAFR